jgi:DNA/RNA endonuclease YhcR with UshA esterase domain
MKMLFLFICVAISFPVRAQEIPKISPDQAKDFIGKTVTVCGDVAGTYVSKTGTNFLSFGAENPNQVFQAVIYEDIAKKFSEAPATAFKGKKVCITGVVSIYKMKPEIEVMGVDWIALEK